MKISERELSEAVSAFLADKGGKVFAEVATLGQSADLVWISNDLLTFIEVKVNATSRAIAQCRAHELVADYICIATINKSLGKTNLDKLEELGYGLLSLDVTSRDIKWLVEPRRLEKFWQPIRDQVIGRISKEGEDAN